MIWWLWSAFLDTSSYVHTFDVNAAYEDPEPDVSWLGEGAWVFRSDLMGIGLR